MQRILLEMVEINKTHSHSHQTLRKIFFERVNMKISDTPSLKQLSIFPTPPILLEKPETPMLQKFKKLNPSFL